jgi:hypothetical protein
MGGLGQNIEDLRQGHIWWPGKDRRAAALGRGDLERCAAIHVLHLLLADWRRWGISNLAWERILERSLAPL